MATFEEKLTAKILKENIIWELGGFQNMVFDEEMEKEEFEKMLTEAGAFEIATNVLHNAYKSGYLESPMNNTAIEAKHLKFIGNDRLDYIKQVSARNALKQFVF